MAYSGAAATFTLPSGLNVKGWLHHIKNATATQTPTLNTTSSETISGSTSLGIPAGQSVQLITSGAASGTATYEVVSYNAATSTGTVVVSASNGLNATGGVVKLGGTLSQATDVALAGKNITFSGAGYLGLGTNGPAGKLHLVADASNGLGDDDYIFDDYGVAFNNLSNQIFMRSSRGSVATPLPLVNGDPMGGIVFAPRLSTGIQYGGSGMLGYYKGDGTTAFTDLRFKTTEQERMRIDEAGNVGIGNNAPHAPLQFASTTANRKIVLYEGANNDHQFYGLGLNGATFRYQLDATSSSHVFFAGSSATTSVELMRIKGTGQVGIGTSNTPGVLNLSGALGSTDASFTAGFNITNTTGAGTNNTLSITPGVPGGSGLTAGAMVIYDLPNTGNQIFSDNVIPSGTNGLYTLGDANNRWATVYGVNGDFSGSMTNNVNKPTTTAVTAAATDYFVVPQFAGTTTYTLPAATTSTGRTLIFFAKAGGLTLSTTAANGIIGSNANNTVSATYAIAQFKKATVISDGTNWIIVSLY